MRRKLWTAVLVTVVLMVLGGNLPGRLPASWLAAGSAAWDGMVARVPALWDGAVVAAAALRDRLAPVVAALAAELQTPPAAVGAAGLLAALAGACFALALAGRRRDPFKAVVREVRGGRPVARAARRTRLAQDAVRTLLRPDRATRRRSRRRREEPSAPAWLSGLNRRREADPVSGMRWVESS